MQWGLGGAPYTRVFARRWEPVPYYEKYSGCEGGWGGEDGGSADLLIRGGRGAGRMATGMAESFSKREGSGSLGLKKLVVEGGKVSVGGKGEGVKRGGGRPRR